ncbi:MAG: ribonuclease HII [Patescibacteria group bacterium]
MTKKIKYIIGIDEVGRGPLAGPVTVAAVAVTVNSKFRIKNAKLKLKDSKKLLPKQREEWFYFIKQQKISFAIASVSPKIIDKINISNAANLAATRAVKKLLISNQQLIINSCKIFLDGGLYLNKNIRVYPLLKKFNPFLSASTIIKGDEKIPAISLASIVAKVARDRMMMNIHKKYPRYGFDKHKGYGTKQHIKMIKKYGLSPIHRKSFRLKK